jgi:hypothetical protein
MDISRIWYARKASLSFRGLSRSLIMLPSLSFTVIAILFGLWDEAILRRIK